MCMLYPIDLIDHATASNEQAAIAEEITEAQLTAEAVNSAFRSQQPATESTSCEMLV